MIEYLQVGYRPEEFEKWGRELVKRPNKTAVDPNPTHNKHWQPKVMQDHHVYVEPFVEFAKYIPNQYDVIEFYYSPTDYEMELANGLLSDNGKIVLK